MTGKRKSFLFLFFCMIVPSVLLSFGVGQEQSEAENQKRESLSEASKMWLEEVVPYIISNAEKKLFINLPTEKERGKFIENFWKRRDPNPATPENEFKLEYYKRIALANKFFGASGIEGWRTDRGKIYILLGPPHNIERDMRPSSSLYSASHGPKETWNYWGLSNPKLPYNLEFVFVDKLGTGNYVFEKSLGLTQLGSHAFDLDSLKYYFDYMENMAEAMRNPFEELDKLRAIITTQVTYSHIPFKYDLFYLKGSEERTYIPLVIEIPYSSIPPKKINKERYFSLTIMVNVSNNLGQMIFERNKNINFKHNFIEMNSLKDKTFKIQTFLSLEPEDCKLHLLVLDNFSGKVGTSHQEISVPKFNRNVLDSSDIILSSEEFGESKIEIEKRARSPVEAKIFSKVNHVFRSDQELNVYFEVYNLSLSHETRLNNFKVEYSFLSDGKLLAKVTSPSSDPSDEKDCRIQTSFRLKNFKPGEYTLLAKVIDLNSGKSLTKETQFVINQ